MPFEKKCECVGAEATFCTNEKLTRIDKKKSRMQLFRNCRGWAFKAQEGRVENKVHIVYIACSLL